MQLDRPDHDDTATKACPRDPWPLPPAPGPAIVALTSRPPVSCRMSYAAALQAEQEEGPAT